MEKILQILLVIILSSTKFLTAPITSLNIGISYGQTLLITSLGGILGVVFFYSLSKAIVYFVSKVGSKVRKKEAGKKKRVFTFKNKLIVRVKVEYGLIGLAAVTPIFLSIPLGTFLAARYFQNTKKVIFYLSASVIVWSVIVSSVVIIF